MSQSLVDGPDRNSRDNQRTAETGSGGTTVAEEGEKGSRQRDQTNGADGESNRVPTGKGDEPQMKPSKLKEMWGKIGLDIGTVLMMFKGSLAPIIGVAFYQADSVASTFGTIGYLVPIVTVLAITIMPRAKFIQTLILNTIGICLGSAVALLGIWSAVKARQHTSPPGFTGYNSSQSAVCGIWLFANIWFVNTLRAKLPALQFPVIMFSIFTNVAFSYGALFPTVASAESFVRQLLTAFLTAFAIATGVNLFIIPVSSRKVVFKESAGYLMLVRKTVKAEVAYLESLEHNDMFSGVNAGSQSKSKKNKKANRAQTPEAAALKGCVIALTGLHGKLNGDLPFAKRDVAYGKLGAKDLDEIFAHLRAILIPLIGISTITDIFERIAERRAWVEGDDSDQVKSESWERCEAGTKAEEIRVWNQIMKTLHEPFAVAAAAMDQALEHTGIVLELFPTPKKAKKTPDVEAEAGNPKPGHPDFSKNLKEKMAEFYNRRGKTLKTWAREKGLSDADFDAGKLPSDTEDWTSTEAQHQRDQQQLYLILYLEHLLFSTGMAITKLVEFADSKVADGTMSKKRLILPGYRRMKKWILSIGKEDTSLDSETPDSMESGNHNVYMGAGFHSKKDPEHLPAKNAWEKFGNGIRTIPRFLGSTESAFGFRVALATMTIGILAFLRDTQTFFMQQRLVWAMIIIAIGMTMTSGQSMFGFFGRVAGTAIAMVLSMLIWYIVDERTPGIIVMLWLFIFLEMYFFIKFPRFIPVWLVAIVTQILIVGYELQVRKIGIEASTASGQPYYPIYLLAPYRLACVAGGSFVAFIWTIFPYPLTDRSWLRQDLGSTLYLLANYYSVVHSTIEARLHDTEGDMTSKHSPGRRLEKVRHQVFAKLLMLLPSLTSHAEWQKWEVTIGGKFPREIYDAILLRTTNIMHYLSLMSFSTQNWAEEREAMNPNTTPETRRKWINDLATLTDKVSPTSHQITSTLSLLSASVRTGSALPPYIQLPEPYNLSRKLEALDKGILSVKNIEEPGYSAYAVMQVASSLVSDDLAKLVEHVVELVGETNFSFTVPVSGESFGSEGSGSSRKGKRD